MIAKVLLGADFAGLYQYLTAPKKGVRDDQVRAQHLVDTNPIAELRKIARLSRRVRKPCMHLIVGWAPDEEPTLDQQFEAGSRLLARLDLAEHQALFVVHDEPKDGITPGKLGRHHELHCLVNRVGFDGRVASSSFSYARVERAVADVALEFDFRRIPGRFNAIEGNQTYKSEGRSAGVQGETGGGTIAASVLSNPELIAALLDARRSDWETLITTFASHGLRLGLGPPARRKDLSRGLVMIDKDGRRIKLSSLDGCGGLKWGAGALVKELGPLPDDRIFSEVRPTQAAVNQIELQTHARFVEERLQASYDRKQHRLAHARERQNINEKTAAERHKFLALAKHRRLILYKFFGRASPIRRFMNFLLDDDLMQALGILKNNRNTRLTELRDQYAAKLPPLPRWVEWRRREAIVLTKNSSLRELNVGSRPSRRKLKGLE